MFWRNARFQNSRELVSTMLGREVILSTESIAKVTSCIREQNQYKSEWAKQYGNYVGKVLCKNKSTDSSKIEYKNLCEEAKIWQQVCNKSILHKAGSKDSVTDLHKFVIFHLMEGIPFNLPHTIYINIL